jgi:hypothetical protein
MWRRVDIVLTDISEERIASIFRVEKISKRGTSVSGSTSTEPSPFLSTDFPCSPSLFSYTAEFIRFDISMSAHAHAGCSLADFLFSSTLKMEAIRSF